MAKHEADGGLGGDTDGSLDDGAGEWLSMETERRKEKKKKEIKKKEENHGKGCLGREKTREKWEKGEAVKIYLKKKTRAAMDLYLKRSRTEKCM